MTLTTTAQLLQAATEAGRGVCAFNVINLEYAEAVLVAADAERCPVILQLSENAVRFHAGNPIPLTAALSALASTSSAPVGLHLDHVEDERLLKQSAEAGFSSVMFDAGSRPYSENVEATARAAQWAHAHGLAIEAELGYVGGKATQVVSAHSPGVRTDPQQAADFVAATGVDALAVAVGSSHAMTTRRAVLDIDLIAQLRKAVAVPLVLHGSSGVPDDSIAAAVRAGMRKINIGTILGIAFTRAVRRTLEQNPENTDPRSYLSAARAEVADVVSALIRTVGQSNPTSEVNTHT